MPFAPVVTAHPTTHRQFFASPGRRREEYLEGVVYPLLSVDRQHQRIMENLTQALAPQLTQSPCELLENAYVGNGPTLQGTPTGQFSYATEGAFVRPDIVILLDRPNFFVPSNKVIINPCVIVEVMTPEEQDYATGLRFEALRQWLDRAFHTYVLIGTQHPEVAVYTRSGRDDWSLSVHEALDDVIRLPRVGCAVTLGELYAGLRDAGGRPYLGPALCPHCGKAL